MKKKLVFGMGINDADYKLSHREVINNKRKMLWRCPFYTSWAGMLKRCYSQRYHEKFPTYVGCLVCDEWLTFSKFKLWMETQDWQGQHLDKDILIQDNKIYSPQTCVFVSGGLNSFMLSNDKIRGKYLIGVYSPINSEKFLAQCKNPFTKNTEYLGSFTDQYEAHEAWRKHKHEIAIQYAELQTDPRLEAVLRTRFQKTED